MAPPRPIPASHGTNLPYPGGPVAPDPRNNSENSCLRNSLRPHLPKLPKNLRKSAFICGLNQLRSDLLRTHEQFADSVSGFSDQRRHDVGNANAPP